MITRSVLFERFAGRDKELAHLTELRARSARELKGYAVSIAGEAGVGKSRLLTEFAALGRGDREAFVRVRCDELPVAYAPFVDALDALSEIRGLRKSVSVIEAIDAARSALTIAPSKAGADAAERKRANFSLLVAAIGQAARRCGQLTLALDDVHWSDLSSLEALLALVRSIASLPLLVVFTYRPEDLEADHARTAAIVAIEREVVDRMSLLPLHLRDIATLLRIPVPDADAAMTRRIFELSDGRPYVAEELARSVVEWGAEFEHASPLTLSGAVLGRAAQLSSPHRSVIEHAAVIGRNFAPDDLRALGISQDDLYGALRAGLALQLLEQTEVAGVPWFRFRHALTREILYRHLPATEREALHRDIADHLASDEKRIAEFAYHVAAAGDAERAAAANELAGDRAGELLASADAIQLYSRALDFVADDGDACARIALKIARLTFLAGDSDELLDTNVRNAQRLIDGGRRDDAAAVLHAVARTLTATRFQRSIELLERASSLLSPTSPDSLRVDIEFASVRVFFETGRIREAAHAFSRAKALCPEPSDEQKITLAVHEILLAYFANDVPGTETAIARLQTALGAHPAAEAHIKKYSALVAYERGETRRALELTREAGEIFQRVGQKWQARLTFECVAMYAADLGDFALVRSFIGKDEHQGFESGQAFDVARCLVTRAVGTDIEPELRAFERAMQYGTASHVTTLAAHLAFMLDSDRKRARALLLRAMTRLPMGKVDGLVVNAVVEYVGGNEAAELVTEFLQQPGVSNADYDLEAALIRARQARHVHRSLEAANHARVALDLAKRSERWVPIYTAQELLGDLSGARATLLRIGAVAELARLEARCRSVSPVEVSLPKLTQREEQIARAFAAGSSSSEIGDRLAIAPRTVQTHLANVYAKYGIKTRAELIELLAVVSDR